MMFALPLIWAGTRRALMSNRNDVKDWLPSDFPETKVHSWFNKHFPHEQFVLVSWEGCTLSDQRLELLAQKLEPPENDKTVSGKPWRFKSVITGQRLVDDLEARYEDLPKTAILKRLEGSLIGEDHSKTCLIVTLSEVAKGKQLRPTLEGIRKLAEECNIRREDLRLGGPPVDNVAIDVEGERTLYRLAGISAFVGLAISWLCLRSIRLTLIVFWTAILAAGVSLSIVYFSSMIFEWATMDAILLSMPSLVYVLAISGAIHIVNYYHDDIVEHGLEGSVERAVGHAWKPCSLAALTTSLGLVSLCISDVVPIAKFGLFSALGVMATLVLLFFMLPALLNYFPSRDFAEKYGAQPSDNETNNIFDKVWGVVGDFVIRRNIAVSCVGLVLLVILAIGLANTKTSVKLMKLFSPSAEIINHYTWLEEHLGPLVPMEVVIHCGDECNLSMVQRMRLVRDIEHTVEQMADKSGGSNSDKHFAALSAATFAPPLGKQRLTYSTRDSITSKRLQNHREDMHEYLTYDQNTKEELWRVSARVWALTDMDYAEFVTDLKQQVEPVLDAYKQAGVKGVRATYTGLVPLVYKTQHELMSGLYESLASAFGLIAIVMMFVLRSPSAGLLSMIPNLFPVMMVFGIMGWAGILVDVGAMMTASVALGVAVDDTIHYLTWFRDGLDQGYDRKGAVLWSYKRCATAMSQTTLIGGLGLAAFAFSTFTPTQRFGVLMLTLLSGALIGDLIFLPALLTSPLGRIFHRGKKKQPTLLVTTGGEPDSGPPSDTQPTDGSSRSAVSSIRRDRSHRTNIA